MLVQHLDVDICIGIMRISLKRPNNCGINQRLMRVKSDQIKIMSVLEI